MQEDSGRRRLTFILEAWVLDCIGELDTAARLQTEQAVQRLFGGGRDWHATLRQAFSAGTEIESGFRDLWFRGRAVAEKEGSILSPTQFAMLLVKENFQHLIEG